MKVLFAASEAHPFIKTGGLGDVMGALPQSLANLGVDARVVIPKYKNIKDELKQNLQFIKWFTVPVGWRNQYCGVFQYKYKDVVSLPNATINTESPAWAVDRLSILALKIYHMQQEVDRTDTTKEHHDQCLAKLSILLEQQKDLSTAIDQLLTDIEAGRKYMKVYKQMKMYNDPALNPVLYAKK